MTFNKYANVFWRLHVIKPMSKDGLARWNISRRSKLHKKVFLGIKMPTRYKSPYGIPTNLISTDEGIACFLIDEVFLWEGRFNISMFFGKKKGRYLWLKIFTIEIYDTENYKYKIEKIVKSRRGRKLNRIDRLWFRK